MSVEIAGEEPTILQVLPSLETGGVERSAVDIAGFLVSKGWRSIVASEGGRLQGAVEESGSEHITLPLASKNPVTILVNARRLTELLREMNIDIIHARSRAPAWSAYIASRRTGTPFVTTYHAAYKQKSAFKAWYNSVMGKADRIIANSGWTAELVAERHPKKRDAIISIPRGMDLSEYDRTRISQDRIVSLRHDWGLPVEGDRKGLPFFLLLGRLTPIKGQEAAIRALYELGKDGYRANLVLAGDDQGRQGYREMLTDLAGQLGIKEHVFLPGHCADVAAAFASCDIALMPSLVPEAFGRAAVEAGALGVPVIASNVGGPTETILAESEVGPTKRTGWRTAPGDVEALARAMREALVLDPSERDELGVRAREHILQNYTLEKMGERTLTVYQSLLRKDMKNSWRR